MGFNASSNQSALHAVRYSAFLGALYLATAQAEESIKAVKADIGEDEVKKGFQGSSGDSSSAKALRELRSKGVLFGNMVGRLTGVRLLERDVNGRPTPYLSVTVTDDDGKFNLSVAATSRASQMLIRKLANATPELVSEIGLFATYGKREGADRAYAEHGASLLQNGTQVRGVDPKEILAPTVEAAMAKLKDAGVDDKETCNRRRAAVELEFHLDLLKKTQAKFDAYYKARELPVPQEDTSIPPTAGVYEDDSIPF